MREVESVTMACLDCRLRLDNSLRDSTSGDGNPDSSAASIIEDKPSSSAESLYADWDERNFDAYHIDWQEFSADCVLSRVCGKPCCEQVAHIFANEQMVTNA